MAAIGVIGFILNLIMFIIRLIWFVIKFVVSLAIEVVKTAWCILKAIVAGLRALRSLIVYGIVQLSNKISARRLEKKLKAHIGDAAATGNARKTEATWHPNKESNSHF